MALTNTLSLLDLVPFMAYNNLKEMFESCANQPVGEE